MHVRWRCVCGKNPAAKKGSGIHMLLFCHIHILSLQHIITHCSAYHYDFLPPTDQTSPSPITLDCASLNAHFNSCGHGSLLNVKHQTTAVLNVREAMLHIGELRHQVTQRFFGSLISILQNVIRMLALLSTLAHWHLDN